VASDDEFGTHDRNTQQQNADDVNRQKCAAAIGSGNVGKSPDIS